MTDKELKKLNRKELLEMLIQQGEQVASLQKELRAAEASLEDRSVKMKNAGTMAEAALSMNGVYEAADNAAREYLENIKRCNEQQQAEYDRIVRSAEKRAEEIISEAEKRVELVLMDVESYWRLFSQKTEEFGEARKELTNLLEDLPKRGSNE